MSDRPGPGRDTMDTRGVLYPARLPTFTRLAPADRAKDFVRWFWIPEWDVPAGRKSRQHVIAYPASNLVVEGGSVELVGPTTRASHRDLTDTGWAVGALLRPAAVRSFVDDPGALADAARSIDAPALCAAVTRAMQAPHDRHTQAVEAFSDWLVGQVPPPDEEATLANALTDLIDSDSSVMHVADAASRLGMSVRTAQRLCRRYVGVPPAAMIRRRRLQQAAEAVRTDPGIDLADLAAELGYADHAHLTRDFRAVLGFTPSGYRGTHID